MLAACAGLVSGLPLMHRTFYIRLARVEEAAGAVGSLFPLEGGMGLRSVVYDVDARRPRGRPRTHRGR
jgi:hypothetical protein